jgi:hypothetical protein
MPDEKRPTFYECYAKAAESLDLAKPGNRRGASRYAHGYGRAVAATG